MKTLKFKLNSQASEMINSWGYTVLRLVAFSFYTISAEV